MDLFVQQIVMAEGGGLSVLLEDTPGLIIWTWVVFGGLIFVLGKFAWKPLLTALDKRETSIRESVETAERLQGEAEVKMREYEEHLSQAKSEAHAIVEEGRRDAVVLRQEIESKAQDEAQTMIDRGRREIDLARDKALEQIRTEAVDISIKVAEKVLKKNLSSEDNQKLAKDALSSLGKGKSDA